MSDDNQFARLAALAAKLAERRAQFEGFRKLIEPLASVSLDPADTVEGETFVYNDMKANLEQVFDRLRNASAESDLDAAMHAMDELLDDVPWEISELLSSDLEEKLKRVESLVKEAALDLKEWDRRLSELSAIVDGARLEGAPFPDLERALNAARSTAARVRSALADRIYSNLKAQKEDAENQIRDLEHSVKDRDGQIGRVKKLVKQADLLIMQVGVSENQYEYRVLLRSADRYQTRGINIIQDVRPVSKADRDWMKDQLRDLTASVNNGLRSAYARKSNAPRTIVPADPVEAEVPSGESMRRMARLGEFMFRLVIPEQIQKYLQNEEWSFSITTNDLDLPWELICFGAPEPGENPAAVPHLCVLRSISRMPLGGVFPAPPQRRPNAGPRKRQMLLIHSDPRGTLTKAAEEVDTIAEALKDQVEFVRLNPDQATNGRLNDILMSQSFDFIHYAGHARFDAVRPNESGLELKDSILTAQKIRALSKGSSLVFLNACDSGTVARETEAQQVSYLLTNPEPVVGLASAFVYSGAQGCVGSLWPVYDKPAAELAVKFYRSILAGETAGEAIRMARFETRQNYPDEITWAAYVLYGDPTFRLA